MDFKEIQELIKLVNKSGLTEFRMKKDDFEIVVRTKYFGKGGSDVEGSTMQTGATPVAVQAQNPPDAQQAHSNVQPADLQPYEPAVKEESKLLIIKSPIVGTFYRSTSPDKPPYKKVGDTVVEGDVVCIVEAMKLFNEIESEVSGTIVKVLVEDASPVEYDQPLFLVDPKG